MKKIFLITLLVCLTGLQSRAQKIIYGAEVAGGIAYQQIRNSEVLSTGIVRTFNFKGVVQMPVLYNLWLESALGVVGKGGVFYQDALTTTIHATYLQVHVNLMRKLNFTDLGVFYLGAGGYLARGINGTIDYETPGTKSTDKLKFGQDNDMRRYDAGLDFMAGFEFRNHLTFNIGYNLGLNNLASAPQKDTGTGVVRNREFTVGLGYLIK